MERGNLRALRFFYAFPAFQPLCSVSLSDGLILPSFTFLLQECYIIR